MKNNTPYLPIDVDLGLPVKDNYEAQLDRQPIEKGAPIVSAEAVEGNENHGVTFDMVPRSVMAESLNGGYAQEWDQSYPASGPRATSGTRGANDSKTTTGRLTITDVPSKEK